jgi:deoxyribodipyrimidine photo-lyase
VIYDETTNHYFHSNMPKWDKVFALLAIFIFGSITTPFIAAMKTSTSATSRRLILHWFRHGDLRLHDNPALYHTSQLLAKEKHPATCVIPFFCFDTSIFGSTATTTPYGTLKCGPKRAKFILESVTDLRQNLRTMGSHLVVGVGNPADFVQSLLQSFDGNFDNVTVVCQDEVVREERAAVQAVSNVLKNKVVTIWGSTMYDRKDLPFDTSTLHDMPDVFTPFRNAVEKKSVIAKPLPAPSNLRFPKPDTPLFQAVETMVEYMPTLQDLGYSEEHMQFANTHDARGVMEFRGGETAALARVKEYIWEKDLLKDYFETRNGMIGADYSTKLSPWLAHGCLSPRLVAMECKKYEEERIANKSTYWVVFELLWRDFCKFFACKHGDSIFFPSGTVGRHKKWSTYAPNFEAWKEGRTGYPLVDANMREMKATGFMSNRGRQNVASFLAIDLEHDWRFGADWFESNLIDYDVYSNWVNWCAAAGMTGGRLNRFNIVKQSKDYDQHGDYVRHWLPELKHVPNEFVHEPWKMTQFQQTEFHCRLGVDYPNPIIPPSRPAYIHNSDNGNQHPKGKPRKPNNNSQHNRHQKYEMKSLKQGGYHIL